MRRGQAASLLHSDGDAMDIGVHDGRIVEVRGRHGDRFNPGQLEPQDLYTWQSNAARGTCPTCSSARTDARSRPTGPQP